MIKVIQGYVDDSDDLRLKENKEDYYSPQVVDVFRSLFKSIEHTELQNDDSFYHFDGFAKDIKMSMYSADSKVPLDELKEDLLLQSYGILKMESSYYGYSEWTILGIDINTLKFGGHDLHNLISQQVGRYIYIEIEQL